MRKAEQRWPAESNADEMTSATTCSASAEESTTIALRPPVSAISARGAPRRVRRPASSFSISRATGVEPVKTTPWTRGSATSAAADFARPRHELEPVARNAGFVQQRARLRRR